MSLEYENKWESEEKFPLTLWETTYCVALIACVANIESENICEKQEMALGQFKEIVETSKKEMIENFIMNYFRVGDALSAAERFTLKRVKFTQKGEYVIYFYDSEKKAVDNWVTRFELTLASKGEVYPPEEYVLCMGKGTFYERDEK